MLITLSNWTLNTTRYTVSKLRICKLFFCLEEAHQDFFEFVKTLHTRNVYSVGVFTLRNTHNNKTHLMDSTISSVRAKQCEDFDVPRKLLRVKLLAIFYTLFNGRMQGNERLFIQLKSNTLVFCCYICDALSSQNRNIHKSLTRTVQDTFNNFLQILMLF
jgi:hypothetical protein